jgi:sulfoxide reductase heme-binding subunit YedZ
VRCGGGDFGTLFGMKWLMEFDRLAVQQKKMVVKLMWGVMLVYLALVGVSGAFGGLRPWWRELGEFSGKAAVIVYLSTLVPGILKRLGAGGGLAQIQLLLMTFRRQLGILAYFLVLGHYCWERLFPSFLNTGISAIPVSGFELWGMAAFFVLTPLFVTSNDWSMRVLGAWWKRIHALTYGVIGLIFGHVLLQQSGSILIVVIGLFGFAEIVSFGVMWMRIVQSHYREFVSRVL